jgi:small-conductance mechanosensitive channel
LDSTFSAKFLLGVGYESDLDHVEKVTLDVAKEVVKEMDEHVKDFTPIVRVYEFGDSSINLKVFFKVYNYGAQWPIFHEFIKQLLVRYNKEGINIPFPIRTLYHMNNIEMDSE